MDGSERLAPQVVGRLVKELKDLIEKPPEGITVRVEARGEPLPIWPHVAARVR